MSGREIIVLPSAGCRRSRRIIEYLEHNRIAFTRIPIDSPEGASLAARYDFRASPGILVDGISVNPFDLLILPACRVDEKKARQVFLGNGK